MFNIFLNCFQVAEENDFPNKAINNGDIYIYILFQIFKHFTDRLEKQVYIYIWTEIRTCIYISNLPIIQGQRHIFSKYSNIPPTDWRSKTPYIYGREYARAYIYFEFSDFSKTFWYEYSAPHLESTLRNSLLYYIYILSTRRDVAVVIQKKLCCSFSWTNRENVSIFGRARSNANVIEYSGNFEHTCTCVFPSIYIYIVCQWFRQMF